MKFKCKPTTKQHLIDVMGKWFNLFVNQNHYQIMNSYKCVEFLKIQYMFASLFPFIF
jgi:hypothetical protein